MAERNPWLGAHQPLDQPVLRFFCFPYAGRGAGAFQTWIDKMPVGVELCRVQLPGRETRFVEPAIDTLPALMPSLERGLAPLLDRPFAVLGHSMGAIVAFEWLRRLRDRSAPLPLAFYPSGHRAPHLPRRRKPMSHLPHDEFVHRLREMDGTPEELLANEELLEVVLPTVRADLHLWETYQHQPAEPLPCPLVTYGGTVDKLCPPEDMEPWSDYTSAGAQHRILEGGHFFLHSKEDEMLATLRSDLESHVARIGGARQ